MPYCVRHRCTYLVVMDRLLTELKQNKAGISICNLYLGGAAHADDVRAIASSTQGTEDQGKMIANIATKNGLSLNESKTEIVLFSRKPSQHTSTINFMNSTVPIIPEAKCLGYLWHKSLSARPAVEQNIAKARRQFFTLGSTSCYLGQSNPLSARTVVETCILPTLCYGAENWILDDISLDLLNRFQSELGKRILRLSRFHSHLAPLYLLCHGHPWLLESIFSSLVFSVVSYPQNMTPWPLELSTHLPPKTSSALVFFSSAFFLIQSLVQMPLPPSSAIL